MLGSSEIKYLSSLLIIMFLFFYYGKKFGFTDTKIWEDVLIDNCIGIYWKKMP